MHESITKDSNKKYRLTLLVGVIFVLIGFFCYIIRLVFGCEYKQVQCIKAPCNPIVSCSAGTFMENFWENNYDLEILNDKMEELFGYKCYYEQVQCDVAPCNPVKICFQRGLEPQDESVTKELTLSNNSDQMDEIYLNLAVNNQVFDLEIELNSTTQALIERLYEDSIVINAKDFGGFEKVGSLGFSLPTSDKYIETHLGDVVLYNGDQISLFYNDHAWSYTKIGRVVDTEELLNVLGEGPVKLELSLQM